jgi:hypothetical protein
MGKQDRECALCGKIIVDVQESCILTEAIGGILDIFIQFNLFP